MSLAPIVLFTFNRPKHTEKTLEALSKNTLAKDSDLFIFCDGPKENASKDLLTNINITRNICKKRKWCKTVTIIEFDTNKGLASNIIDGVTNIINRFGKIIVLEDDIVTGKYFLEYMNTALDKYKDKKKVMHITGWRDPIKRTKTDSSFFYPTMDCWGWATWADRWKYLKKNPIYYKSLFTEKMIWEFNIEGTDPWMWNQMLNNYEGKLNTWAIFWYAAIFEKHGLCLAPCTSLCKNVGFDFTGTNCGDNKFQTITRSIDHKILIYPESIVIDKKEFDKNKKFIKRMRTGGFSFFVKSHIPVPLKNILKKIFF